MMFGMPAAALAIYHTAQSKQQKQVYAWFLASSIGAFFVGVTEPIEFAFMFVAPVLFIIHALLTGLSLFIAALFHWTAGFAFSAGLIDYSLSLINPVANHPLMLLVQGVCFFVLYYVIFRVVIQVFNLNTIGRGIICLLILLKLITIITQFQIMVRVKVNITILLNRF